MPIVNVLYAFSAACIEGIGLVAKDVTASQDALVDIFERIKSFFRWLEEYSEVPTTEAMKDIVMKEVQMAIVQMLKVAYHIKDGVEAVGDNVNVAIEDGKVVKVTPMETLWTHYKRPSRPIAIRKPSPSSLALSGRLGGCPSFPGEFEAADLGGSASVNSSAAAIFSSASPLGGSVESLL
ncbi:hypothetical protein EDB83DRAFT_2320780 [Lactarius deliciosus]|nr:hypothetical protein EDB83DRAFT_2320780 [Lactarius deliciosus]